MFLRKYIVGIVKTGNVRVGVTECNSAIKYKAFVAG